jgi:hypothetical protein
MNRRITAGVAIVAVLGGVGWKLATQPETSTRLEDIRLMPHSEHSLPGPTEALAGIRIRLSPSDFNDQITAAAHEIPQIALAAE